MKSDLFFTVVFYFVSGYNQETDNLLFTHWLLSYVLYMTYALDCFLLVVQGTDFQNF